MTFRLGFVTGATPDKWVRAWRDRFRESIELVPLTPDEQLQALLSGEVTMALVRLPVPTDDLHLIRLYDEVQVVVAGLDHFIAAAEEVELGDLRQEQLVLPHQSGWTPEAEQLPWPAMSPKDAIETVAAGTGVAIVPMSIGRLFQRKDTVQRPVTDLEPTTVGLAWLREADDERTQAFVGIVRGRTANSSRG
jgi:DNA-binding transcriptional LysR family regulator